VEEEPESFID
jgi:hypothetical protein